MSAGGSEIRDPGYRLHKKKPTSCMRNFLHCKQIRKLSYGFLHLFISIYNTTTTIKIFIQFTLTLNLIGIEMHRLIIGSTIN